MDIETTEAMIKALKVAHNAARQSAEHVVNGPNKPWSGDGFVDKKVAAYKAADAIEDQIISLEYSLGDPENYAEQLMEIQCAIALSGNYDDDPELYLLTSQGEERFQRGIYESIQRQEHVDSFYGPCPTCGVPSDFDESVNVEGYFTCEICIGDVLAFATFLGFATGLTLVQDERTFDWSLKAAGAVGDGDTLSNVV